MKTLTGKKIGATNMEKLKIYQVCYDTITITALAKNKEDLFNLMIEDDDNYIVEDGDLKYVWNGEYGQICDIEEIPFIRGIIHAESH